MTDGNSRDRIFKAVRERIKEADDKERIQMIANAIGDRRTRDLVDILARIESEDGWSTVLEYLLKAKHQKYFSPLTIGQDKTNLEDLKYREMVFELLSCKGLEPIKTETIDLLKELDDELSLLDASRSLVSRIEQTAIEQINSGDTLFFDFLENTSVSQKTLNLIDQIRRENLQKISLEKSGTMINIEPLWYSEYGRLALSTIGIKGFLVNSDNFDSVLSVIQIPNSIKSNIVETSSFKDRRDDLYNRPTNEVYRKLHEYLIHHDIDNLSILGSRYSVSLLNTLLDEVFSIYEESPSTSGYRNILNCINAHISTRSIESILVLEKSSQMKDTRITTIAIMAIGSFYHESSAMTLVNLLCTAKSNEIEKAATKAIENVYKKCPEADYIISSTLDNECRNRGKLAKIYKRLSKERQLHY
ncbi:MAG: hypothetical protein ACFFCX_00555 [Candidatus Sifarchaeia archaeon]